MSNSPKSLGSPGSPTNATALTKASSAKELGLTKAPKIPKYLSTSSLTKRSYLSASTGNLHGLRNEDYHATNWPLPKMFGQEKYAFSLIDIEDPRYLEECASMGRKLIRLFYDQQIIDLEWRKTYKALLDAEHRRKTLPENARQGTKDKLDREVADTKKYLLELQDQRDMYDGCIQDIYSRCDTIKKTIKKETDLEDLRMEMSNRTKGRFDPEDPFWATRFNTRSPKHRRPSRDWLNQLE